MSEQVIALVTDVEHDNYYMCHCQRCDPRVFYKDSEQTIEDFESEIKSKFNKPYETVCKIEIFIKQEEQIDN